MQLDLNLDMLQSLLCSAVSLEWSNSSPKKSNNFGCKLSINEDSQNKEHNMATIVKLRQGSGKEGQGMALKAKGLKPKPLPEAYIKVCCVNECKLVDKGPCPHRDGHKLIHGVPYY